MDPKTHRICRECKVSKPLEPKYFKRYASNKSKFTFAYQCTECRREEGRLLLHRKYRHIIDDESLKDLVASINECIICGKTGRMFLDHDHVTLKVRGMLCNSCNLGLGHFLDDPELLEFAASYLRELTDFYKPE